MIIAFGIGILVGASGMFYLIRNGYIQTHK